MPTLGLFRDLPVARLIEQQLDTPIKIVHVHTLTHGTRRAEPGEHLQAGSWLVRPDSDGYIGSVRTATITEAKNRLSALLDQVRAGETVVIVDRGLPIARLEPIAAHRDQSGRLLRLERAGLLGFSSAPPPLDLLRERAPGLPPGVSATETLIDERRSAR